MVRPLGVRLPEYLAGFSKKKTRRGCFRKTPALASSTPKRKSPFRSRAEASAKALFFFLFFAVMSHARPPSMPLARKPLKGDAPVSSRVGPAGIFFEKAKVLRTPRFARQR